MKNLFSILQDEPNRIALVAAGLLALALPVRPAQAQSATLDFDTGTPALNTYRGLPIDQTAGGVTAHFSAAAGAFSVQTASSLGGLRLSMFSGRFPAPGNGTGSILEIQFSERVTNITFAFATIQVQPIENETPIELAAYLDSTGTPVGVTNATGLYGGPTGTDSWPMGTLTFASSAPFNLVRIRVPTIVPAPPTGQATDFCVDNLTVERAGGPTCTITASASPAGGGSITGTGGYSVGLTANLVASANLGYTFVNWTEGGTPVSTSPGYSFPASADRTLVANFTPVYTITTSSSPAAGGTTSGGGSYPSGSNVMVVATANAGYAFVNWTQSGVPVSTSASYSFTASANRTLVANFVRTYVVTTSASPGGGGTTSGDGTYNSGSNATVVATANAGYTFVNWTVSGAPVSTLASYSFTVTADRTLVANFTPVTVTYAITTSASPTAGGGTIGDGTYNSGASVTVVATANTGYVFVNWTEGGTPVSSSPSYGFTASANRTLVANFTPVYAITTSASPGAGGSTSGDGTYTNGANVTVVATANAGYAFVNWTEGGTEVSTAASYSFTASANRTLVANLSPLLSLALTAPDTLLLSWPASSTGYVLQQNSALGPSNWVDATNPVNVVGDQKQVMISPLTGSCFFRLFHP